MKKFLKNPWVFTIGTTVIGGVLLTLVNDWIKKVDGSGYCFCFPSENDRRWFYITLMYTNNASIDEYKEDYLKIISSIEENFD